MKRRPNAGVMTGTSTPNPTAVPAHHSNGNKQSSNTSPKNARSAAASTSSSATTPSQRTAPPRHQTSKVAINILRTQSSIGSDSGSSAPSPPSKEQEHDDTYNYALLIALYTLQGIPMGLSASIPFLIQQKVKVMAEAAASASAASAASGAAAAAGAAAAGAAVHHHPSTAKLAYNAQAIFALCSWPFSLKLLWAPVVDAVFWKRFGRRKSWLVPVQVIAGILMVMGSGYVEHQLGLGSLAPGAGPAGAMGRRDLSETAEGWRRRGAAAAAGAAAAEGVASAAESAGDTLDTFDVKGVTAFFFALYFLMATQDIAVDGWALTMLSKKNRGRGPVCNSIGQNLGYFLSFVGFLALNDVESSENLWRPLLGLESQPDVGLVSLGGFIQFMGVLMLVLTTFVALFKREDGTTTMTTAAPSVTTNGISAGGDYAQLSPDNKKRDYDSDSSTTTGDDDDDAELDAAQIGLKETYHRLYAVCQLPSVRWLFLILLTYRLPTALSDNVKFLKAVEFGLSKQTTALLSPTLILPLGIFVPIIAARVWHGHPLRQFMAAYKVRVTLVPLLDIAMILAVRAFHDSHQFIPDRAVFWLTVILSTGMQAIVNSLQFNAQMTFFAHRVDPAIGGSYMTLLNTAANLGGTWPASVVMYLIGQLTIPPDCVLDEGSGKEICTGGRDAYFPMQMVFATLGCLWIFLMGGKVQQVAELPDDAWRTHLLDGKDGVDDEKIEAGESSSGGGGIWKRKDEKAE